MTLMELDGEDRDETISNRSLKSRSISNKLSSSFRLGRSRSSSSALFSDSIPFESGRFAAYERLSESMRLPGDPDSKAKSKRKKSAAWGFISKVFSFRKSGDGDDRAEKRKRKFGSSLLPDRSRRWPVQGWG